MLVLLIIFLITVPVVIQTIPVKLPKVRYEVTQTKPENVSLTVRNGAGRYVRGLLEHDQGDAEELLNRAVKKLEDQIKAVGGVQNINEDNMPEAHIRGDINTQYKCIGAAVSPCRKRDSSGSGLSPSPTRRRIPKAIR